MHSQERGTAEEHSHPNTTHRPRFGTAGLPGIIAHRGASGYRPEHTVAAYELAFQLGADAVEPDIVVSKDGELVIRHDTDLSGTTDVATRPEFAHLRTTKEIDGAPLDGWFVEDFTWAQLSQLRAVERIPEVRPANVAYDGQFPLLRLRDLLHVIDQQKREIGVVAELKRASYFDQIGLPLDELFVAELREAGWASGRALVVESFESTILSRVRHQAIDADFVYLIEKDGAPADRLHTNGSRARTYDDDLTPEGLAQIAASGLAGISIDLSRLLTRDENTLGVSSVPSDATAKGLQTYTWTLRPEAPFLPEPATDWREVFSLSLGSGLDAVFTDTPDLAKKIRESLFGE